MVCASFVRSQENMRVMTASVRVSIWFVTGEQSCRASTVVGSQRHERTPEAVDQSGPIPLCDTASKVESQKVVVRLLRKHKAKTAESAIADDKRSWHRTAKAQSNVPECVLRESRIPCKGLG